MLTISLETLAYIVTKAREFDVEVPPVDEDSGSNPSDDAEWDVLQADPDNPTYQELADAINGLGDPSGSSCWRLPGWAGATIQKTNGVKRSKKHAASTTKRRRNT